MRKPVKVILGVVTLSPLVYLFIAMGFGCYNALFGTSHGMTLISTLDCCALCWVFALLPIYICNIYNNDRVDKDTKAKWILFVLNGLGKAMPIYWYQHIWLDNSPLPPFTWKNWFREANKLLNRVLAGVSIGIFLAMGYIAIDYTSSGDKQLTYNNFSDTIVLGLTYGILIGTAVGLVWRLTDKDRTRDDKSSGTS